MRFKQNYEIENETFLPVNTFGCFFDEFISDQNFLIGFEVYLTGDTPIPRGFKRAKHITVRNEQEFVVFISKNQTGHRLGNLEAPIAIWESGDKKTWLMLLQPNQLFSDQLQAIKSSFVFHPQL